METYTDMKENMQKSVCKPWQRPQDLGTIRVNVIVWCEHADNSLSLFMVQFLSGIHLHGLISCPGCVSDSARINAEFKAVIEVE